MQVDIFDLGLAPESLDLIINCSTIEHVGLGRYGDEVTGDGDVKAMSILRSLLSARGTMLLTIPVGRDAVFMPPHRVYGSQRLPRLLDGFECLEKEFWVKDEHNRWVLIDEDAALKRTPRRTTWGLGCFMLKRL